MGGLTAVINEDNIDYTITLMNFIDKHEN
jgi:hypothetical protein